jgi:trimeric autotransporter adhesin
MPKRTKIGLIVALGALLALLGQASASAADLNLLSGTYTVDTTTLKLTGPGPTDITGVDQGGVAVFSFGGVNIASGVTVNAAGFRPLKIVASGDLTMAGTIVGSGQNSNDNGSDTAGAHPGGPGGGAGGTAATDGSVWTNGSGPGGGGKAASSSDGGAGGGFGGAGARGGINGGGGVGGAAGLAYGNLNLAFQGGSGGSGSGFAQGGGGGGAVALFGRTVTITGIVFADGGGGAVGAGASGGGSGGAIVVHGDSVEVTGFLVARGGDGGRGGCCGAGGGGGGGRIAYQYRTLLASGSALVNGGASGVRSSTGCCIGATGQSLDLTGAPGVVTKAQAASATTGPATAVSSSGATLNGTVNPNSNATSYYFEYGATGAYGFQAPASPASVGLGPTDYVVSQALAGLSPNTTYHYRLVAVDAIGFTTFGSDIGFTTAAAAAAPTKPHSAKHRKCKKGKKRKHGKCVKKKAKKKHHHRHHKKS